MADKAQYVVGTKKKMPTNKCNRKNKNLTCKDNRGSNGNEPAYRSDASTKAPANPPQGLGAL